MIIVTLWIWLDKDPDEIQNYRNEHEAKSSRVFCVNMLTNAIFLVA